ncbi:MAG: hypothetical protein R2686_03070 [Candidatus Nanopelagicales bacterium]
MRSVVVVTAMVVAATPVLAATSPALADEAGPTPDQVSAAKLARQPTGIKGFKAVTRTSTDGAVHKNRLRVLGGTPRKVRLQYSSDGSTWVTVKKKRTDAAGRVRVKMVLAPDRNRWRVRVPATTYHRRVTSPVKTFAVQAPAAETESATPSFPAVTATQIEASKAYARMYILNTYGWGDDQWFALEQLWTRESGWNHLAVNPSSGATGIPQSLPGNKMAAAGADWKTNPQTQIRWGASYIKGRYGDPLGAWDHFTRKNWY